MNGNSVLKIFKTDGDLKAGKIIFILIIRKSHKKFSSQNSTPVNEATNIRVNHNRRYETADGSRIWNIHVIGTSPAFNPAFNPNVTILAGGEGYNFAIIQFHTNIGIGSQAGQDFVVDIYSGVGLAKASMFFMTFLLFVLHLLK